MFLGRGSCVICFNQKSRRLFGLLFLLARAIPAQQDPGVRPGPSGAGSQLANLTRREAAVFALARDAFQEVQSVTGTIPGTEAGLGPTFNGDSCVACHIQPAVGGSSPAANPQAAIGAKNGATNRIPFFIKPNGPIIEARFKYANPPFNSIRDGGVHGLFTIQGRSDAPGCNMPQPDFNAAAAQNNLSFRIPTPTFGLGLVEAISDASILANKTANTTAKQALGISGHENRESNAGTLTRLGWKAQNKSLVIFSGEAYNVEQGVTNEVFPQKRYETAGCMYNVTPEDHIDFAAESTKDAFPDTLLFANFMRMLAPPTPVASFGNVSAGSINNGRTLFASNLVGCALCHTPSLKAGSSPFAAIKDQTANLYSDLLVHNMGSGLADDIVQGSAGPDEFRTAPLWGLGQRVFFLHDGRTSDLMQAIQAHASSGSEANASIALFNRLSTTQKQDLLNFLRSL